MTREELEAKLSALPEEPGSYQMKDKTGTIIYVGKAKNLKNRVRQYFTGSHDNKTTKMVSNIADFDYVVTNSEKEALVLEINLIKQYQPRFNIQFMDDKTYPYIKLSSDPFPTLKTVRERKRDRQAHYFGPYPDVTSARETITLLNQIYPLRKCRKMPKKVCLYYHLGECLGPCENLCTEEEYRELTNKALRFLRGDTSDIIRDLTQKRNGFAENLEFEKAQEVQQTIDAITRTVSKQQVQVNSNANQDVWNYIVDKGYVSISLLLIREGKLAKKVSHLDALYDDDPFDSVISYMALYYETHEVPKEILVPTDFDTSSLRDEIEEHVFRPQKGHKDKLIEMAELNAREYLNRHFTVVNKMDEDGENAMSELSEIVGKPIHRIELFDNSHISGTNAVAGMVVYKNGRPSKKDYRKYNVHNGADDLSNMREVIYRRYFRVLRDQLERPDLLIVDGGDLQIQAAKEILDSLYMSDTISIYGLVKDDNHDTSDLMDSYGNRMHIRKDSALFYLLTRMQDEVHRFAITYHREKRLKSQTASALENIEGIGPKRRKDLLKKFGSFAKVKEASVEELGEVLPKDVAAKVYETFH